MTFNIFLRHSLFIFLIIISISGFSQQIYLGVPEKFVKINSGDVLLLNGIHWKGSYSQFSEIGLKQVRRLDSLLTRLDTFQLELEVHSYYGSDQKFNQRVSDMTLEKIKSLLSKPNGQSSSTIFKSMGNSRPISTSFEYYGMSLWYLNTRIEIKVK